MRALRPDSRLAAWLAALLILVLAAAAASLAQTVPALTGRVVDQADMLTAEEEVALSARLEALEGATSRQLVVVTIQTLQGQTIEDVGFRLGESWKIGDEEADNGAILLIARDERRMRIEVGDGLEPILTDAMSGLIIRETIRPHFQSGDYAGGISAGVDTIIRQLQAPPEEAERRAMEAAAVEREQGRGDSAGSIFPLIFWLVVLAVIFFPLLSSGFRGRKYRGRRRRGGGPIVIWGPGMGGWGGGSSSSSWGGWSGGGGGGWSGGGGFSGGGGSFGGGGASGGW